MTFATVGSSFNPEKLLDQNLIFRFQFLMYNNKNRFVNRSIDETSKGCWYTPKSKDATLPLTFSDVPIAQRIERLTTNQLGEGSIPSRGTLQHIE